MDKKTFILHDSGIRDRCKTYLDTLPLGPDDKPMQITIAPYKKNRSLAQNNLLWLWLTDLSNFLRREHGLDCTPEDLKHEFQARHLGRRTFDNPNTVILKRDWNSDGEYKNHRIIGTSELNTAQFTEFLNEIEVYAANVGLQLPHPEDLYYDAMGVKQ